MASEWIGQVLGAVAKIAPAPLLAFGIATSILIFSPDSLAQTLGVYEFRTVRKSELGGVFIFSWSYLAANFIWWIRKEIAGSLGSRRARRTLERQLHALTPEEKGYLAPYVIGQVNTQYFRAEDGIAGGLTAKKMIFRSSNVFDMLEGVPYNIQPWAKEYLTGNPDLLDGAVAPEEPDSWRI